MVFIKIRLKYYINIKLGLLNKTKHENQKVFHGVHLGGLCAMISKGCDQAKIQSLSRSSSSVMNESTINPSYPPLN